MNSLFDLGTAAVTLKEVYFPNTKLELLEQLYFLTSDPFLFIMEIIKKYLICNNINDVTFCV